MTTRRGGRWHDLARKAAVLGLGAATAAGLLVTGGAGVARAAMRPPVCTPAMLRIVAAGSQGAAGSTYHLLRFTNATRTSCTMRGYPGVSFTDARGHRIGVPAARTGGVPVTTVVLRPGGSAHTTVRIPNPGNFPASACRARTSTYLRVYPPGSRASTSVPLRVSVCSTPAGRGGVQAVATGPGTP